MGSVPLRLTFHGFSDNPSRPKTRAAMAAAFLSERFELPRKYPSSAYHTCHPASLTRLPRRSFAASSTAW